jgi:CubicO group peptidase (beta-lactamase class C family)
MPRHDTALSIVILALAAAALARAEDAAAPSSDTIDAARCKLAAEYSAARRGVSVLLMLDGKILFEDYPAGGSPDRAHELASGTKSFSGVAAAAAVQDGLFKLDDKVSDTIAEWKDDPKKASITIRQLLTLTCGIQTGGEAGAPPPYADAVAMPMVTAPGEEFKYGAVAFQVFGELMKRKLADKKENLVDYLQRRIFDPIGLKVGSWKKGPDGNPTVPSGARLAAREWAKFGELARLGGTWEGKEIVRKDLLDVCFEGTKPNPAYGLTWWLNRPTTPQQRLKIPLLTVTADLHRGDRIPADLVMAAGAGNQRLYVSRERKLVVVRQAEGILNALAGDRSVKWSDAEFLDRLLYGTDASGKIVEPGAEPPPDPAADRAKGLEQLRKRFDKNGDGQLDDEERAAMREFLRSRVGKSATPPGE